MLIITADDLGRDSHSTRTCLECFHTGRVTSASLMVFMRDSEGAARAARSAGLETGLHLNLSHPYDGDRVPDSAKKTQDSVARFFRLGKWTQVAYNPFLKKAFRSVFRDQLDEYHRLFSREPAHFNGHRHMHLSMNMVIDGVIPPGRSVRRSFSFRPDEKGFMNRFYRRLLDAWIERRYMTTDSFFSIEPLNDLARLRRIVDLARASSVELMVHAWRREQRALMISDEFLGLVAPVRRGGFSGLRASAGSRE